MLAQQKELITGLIQNAVDALTAGVDIAKKPVVALERPRDASHGDAACNIATQLARPLKKNPRETANTIVASIMASPAHEGVIDTCEVAGPGFINIRLTPAARQQVVSEVLAAKDAFGTNNRGAGRKVMVEFVSANPTGPLHVGHGRQGALGDAISALFASQGTMSPASSITTMPECRSTT